MSQLPPAPRLPAAELPSITLQHDDCGATHEMKREGGRQSGQPLTCRRRVNTQKLKGLRTLAGRPSECRRMLTKCPQSLSPMPFDQLSQDPHESSPTSSEAVLSTSGPNCLSPLWVSIKATQTTIFSKLAASVSLHNRKQRVSKTSCCSQGLLCLLPVP